MSKQKIQPWVVRDTVWTVLGRRNMVGQGTIDTKNGSTDLVASLRALKPYETEPVAMFLQSDLLKNMQMHPEFAHAFRPMKSEVMRSSGLEGHYGPSFMMPVLSDHKFAHMNRTWTPWGRTKY